ncbi:MAG: MFS transporter [Acidimicrobiales bacterium]
MDLAVEAGPGRGLTVGLVLLVTMVAFEALAVATVLPVTVHELGHVALYGWVFSAFMLANLVGTVWAGRTADRYGPGPALATGLVLFGAGLLAGGLAPSMILLVVARVSQGAGAGAVAAVAYVVIGRAYPSAARPRMFALLSSAWVVPGLIGPALAGAVAQAASWRIVFLGLVPAVAVVGGLTLPTVRRLPRPVAPGANAPSLVDAARLAVGAALLIAGLDDRRIGVMAVLVATGALVALPALRRLLPAGTGTARAGIPAAVLGRGLLTFGYFGTEAFLPLALTTLRHQRPATTGLVLTSATMTWTAASWVNARRAARWGPRRATTIGLTLLVVGVGGAGISSLVAGIPVWVVPLCWGLSGGGMGLAYQSGSLTVLDHAPADAVGATTASLQLSDVLGTALGTGIGGAAVALTSAGHHGARPGIAAIDGLAFILLLGALLVARRLPGPLPS